MSYDSMLLKVDLAQSDLKIHIPMDMVTEEQTKAILNVIILVYTY